MDDIIPKGDETFVFDGEGKQCTTSHGSTVSVWRGHLKESGDPAYAMRFTNEKGVETRFWVSKEAALALTALLADATDFFNAPAVKS